MTSDHSSSGVKQLIYDYITEQYRDDRGIHIETVLSALGALAGYGCQAGIREALVKTGELDENEAFLVVRTVDGESFFFGDFINEPLLSTAPGRISVFRIIVNAMASQGISDYPDVEEIAAHTAKSVGYIHFGTPRLPAGHMPHEMPMTSLTANWKKLYPILKSRSPDPLFWGWEIATVAATLIKEGKDMLSPSLAATVFMEAAIPMSKVNMMSDNPLVS